MDRGAQVVGDRRTLGAVQVRPEHLAPDDLPTRFGRFELVAVLGAGGMGRVFEARMQGPGRFRKSVALKVIRGSLADSSPGVRAGFEREAELGALLRHPHLVDIYDYGEEDGLPWLAMELVSGGTLEDALEGGPLPADDALRFGAQIAAGLTHMHGLVIEGAPAPLVHRDLKPANVLLHHGMAKITDYGLARAVAGADSGTWSNAVAGTPAYMSPEQVRGQPLDGRSDLFSLGAMLFEMLTGEQLLRGASLPELVMQIVRIDEQRPRIDPLDGLVPGIAEVLGRCICHDADARWPDAETFREALMGLAGRGAGRITVPSLVLEPTVTKPAFALPTLEFPTGEHFPKTTGATELAALARLTVVLGQIPPRLAHDLVAPLARREGVAVDDLLRRLGDGGGLLRDGAGYCVSPASREHVASSLLPSDRAEAEATHGRWFGGFGTDAARVPLHGPQGAEVRAERAAMLDDLLAAGGRMLAARAPGAVAWGGHSVLAAARVLLDTARAGEVIALTDPWLARDDLGPALRARLLLVRASSERRSSPREVTAALLDEAIYLAQRIQDVKTEAEASVTLGFLHIGVDPGRARHLVERGLLLLSEAGDTVGAASALGDLAVIDRMQGLFVRSAERFTQALSLLRGRVGPRRILALLVNGWPVFDELGQRGTARAMAEEARALIPHVDSLPVTAAATANLAVLRMRDGAIPEALAILTAGLARARQADRRTEAQYIGGMATMHGFLGDAARAEELGAEAAALLDDLGDQRAGIVLAVHRARGRRLAGRIEGNEALLRDAIVRLDGLADGRAAAEAAVELGWTAVLGGAEPLGALADDALARARRQSVSLTCGALHLGARVAAIDGRWPEATDAARMGRRLARRSEHLLLAAQLDYECGRIALATGDPAEAERLQRRAAETVKALGLPPSSPFVGDIQPG